MDQINPAFRVSVILLDCEERQRRDCNRERIAFLASRKSAMIVGHEFLKDDKSALCWRFLADEDQKEIS
jgi:hypothetical protein